MRPPCMRLLIDEWYSSQTVQLVTCREKTENMCPIAGRMRREAKAEASGWSGLVQVRGRIRAHCGESVMATRRWQGYGCYGNGSMATAHGPHGDVTCIHHQVQSLAYRIEVATDDR